MPDDAQSRRSNDTVAKTLTVALALCVVCSLVVSTAAVTLKPLQEANKALDRKRNILLAAGLLEEGGDVEQLFEVVQPRLVDLTTGGYLDEKDPLTHDPRAAAKDPARSSRIPRELDLARIRRRPDHATVYLVQDQGELRSVILPVYGAGLYSTLYGYIALAGNGNTIQGVRFYEHGETPGLGGEVDNPRWLGKWQDKRVYDERGALRLAVIKGAADTSNPESRYQIDGISGATITSRGVSQLMRYWLGEHGFAPFLARVRLKGD